MIVFVEKKTIQICYRRFRWWGCSVDCEQIFLTYNQGVFEKHIYINWIMQGGLRMKLFKRTKIAYLK